MVCVSCCTYFRQGGSDACNIAGFIILNYTKDDLKKKQWWVWLAAALLLLLLFVS
jgi:uncharacterized integral membrane protein